MSAKVPNLTIVGSDSKSPQSALRPVRIFNTMSRQVELLEPKETGKVGIYTCGPTVYHYAHIGNMRAYIFADTLRRTLDYFGYQVNHVMNITDVGHLTDDGDAGEDKLEVGSRREGLTAWDVAKRFTDAFFEHSKLLNIKKPGTVCKATDHISEQIEMVQMLEKKAYTYVTSDGVYFDTSRFPDYPKLARLDVEGLSEGHRVDQGEKRNKTDFALWKFSKPEDKRAMEWDSPWGRGFPGWHIECSAMARRFLGDQFDIHTGGVDHIPVHHTNEVAQSECATGLRPFVRYWMHGEFLVIEDSEKMSKSTGNFLTVSTLKEKGFDPMAYRVLVLQSHYRKQLRFSMDILGSAQRGLERLRMQVQKLKSESVGAPADRAVATEAAKYVTAFDEAMASDLNTPQALAGIFSLLEDASLHGHDKLRLIEQFDTVLGLDLLSDAKPAEDQAPEVLQSLLVQRNAARAAKNWPEADRLRKEITAAGYDILDSSDGQSRLKRRL